MLTGKMAFEAQTPMASLLKRSQERFVPVSAVDNSIPREVSSIVSRCLEPAPKDRYQSVADLLADLEVYQPSAKTVSTGLMRRSSSGIIIYRWLAVVP